MVNVTIMPRKAGWYESVERAALQDMHCQPGREGDEKISYIWMENDWEGEKQEKSRSVRASINKRNEPSVHSAQPENKNDHSKTDPKNETLILTTSDWRICLRRI